MCQASGEWAADLTSRANPGPPIRVRGGERGTGDRTGDPHGSGALTSPPRRSQRGVVVVEAVVGVAVAAVGVVAGAGESSRLTSEWS